MGRTCALRDWVRVLWRLQRGHARGGVGRQRHSDSCGASERRWWSEEMPERSIESVH